MIKRLYNKIDRSKLILTGLIILMIIISSFISERFFSVDNINNLLKQISSIGIISVGMTLVIITGGIDLSAGYGVTMGAIITGLIYIYSGSELVGILVGVLSCLALGLINALFVVKAKITPFIVTLATMSITQGVLNLIHVKSGIQVELSGNLFWYIGKCSIGFIPISAIIMAVVFILGYIILKFTSLGTYIYAIGSDENNTKLSGINVKINKAAVYAISGICMGLAATVMGSRIVLVTQESGGNSLLMDCIAAVIIGGTSIEGGKGDLGGTILGVLFIGVISSMLVFLSIPAIAQSLFKGLVIIVALFINLFNTRSRKGLIISDSSVRLNKLI